MPEGNLITVGEYFQAEFFATEGKNDSWLTFSFASEQPVKRWWGTLTLSCKRGAMTMEEVLDNNAPFLKDHDPRIQLGMVRNVWLRNRVAYADVEFNNREESMTVREEMLGGLRPGISPLAVPKDDDSIEILTDGGWTNEEVTFKIWSPWEISSVSMAANGKVGVGPNKLSSQPEVELNVDAMMDVARRRYWHMTMRNEPPQEPLEGTPPGSPPVPPAAAPVALETPPAENHPAAAAQLLTAAPGPTQEQLNQWRVYAAEEQKKAATAENLAEIYKLGIQHGQIELAQEFVAGGKSAQEFRDKLLTVKFNPNVRTSPIKNENGHEKFSLAALARAQSFPHDANYQAAAQYELGSIQDAAADKDITSRSAQGGAMVPFSAYAKGGNVLLSRQMKEVANREEQLAVTTATGSAGSGIATLVDLDRTVDFLVEDADVLMHCDVIMGLTGNVQIPQEATAATLGFNAEGTVQAVSNPTFTHVSITPHMLSAQVEISKQSLIQTSGWVERQIRMLLARQFRSQINNYLLNGSGLSDQPTGLITTASLPTISSPGTLANVNWEDVVDVEEKVDNEWVPEMGRLWVIGRAAYKKLLTTLKGGSASSEYILDASGTRTTRTLMGYLALKSSFAAETGTDKGHILYGNFMDLCVGFWDGFEVVIDAVTKPALVIITIMVFWDTVVKRKASFVQAKYT